MQIPSSLSKMYHPTESADLSGIGGNPEDLFVSNVIHKAFVEVNEEGNFQQHSIISSISKGKNDHKIFFFTFFWEAELNLRILNKEWKSIRFLKHQSVQIKSYPERP